MHRDETTAQIHVNFLVGDAGRSRRRFSPCESSLSRTAFDKGWHIRPPVLV